VLEIHELIVEGFIFSFFLAELKGFSFKLSDNQVLLLVLGFEWVVG
jgi:hypothetical protein